MNKQKITIIIAGAVIIIFSFFSMKMISGFKEDPKLKPADEAVRFVKAETVKYSDISATHISNGRVYSQSELTISAEVTGKILEGNVSFKEGQTFRKGDLLLKIYDNEASLNLKAEVSSFLTQLAGILPDMKIDFPETYPKWYNFFEQIEIEKDLPELPEIASTQEKVFLSSKSILSKYYTIKSTESKFKKYSIYAPFNGAISQVNLEVGAIANAGAALAKIINTNILEVEIPLEIENAKWVNVGDKVTMTGELNEYNWFGNVIRKAGDLNQQTQSISIYVQLANNNHKPVYRGQYLKATFSNIPIKNVMEIPRNSVFNSNEVFTIENNALVKTKINVVKTNDKTLFFNGVNENTKLVVEPLINAAEGTKVKIIE
ncbi:MAG: HlyD family efflux transporter periplasmic adaptor subunit [Melioribacteraceae bacterium]